MDLATSGKGGLGTFIGICVISGAFGVADAHVQGGMIGDLSYMTPEFIQVSTSGWHFTFFFSTPFFIIFLFFILIKLLFWNLQSFVAGFAASGALTSALRLITKAAFENSKDGLRKGASMLKFFFLSPLPITNKR